jgi:hypothetical protein
MTKALRLLPKPSKKPPRGFLYRSKGKTPTGRNRHVPDAVFKKALREFAGNFSDTAHALGLARQSVAERVRTNAELRAFVTQVEEEVLDKLESLSLQIAGELDASQIRWLLDRKGRGRGYGQHIAHVDETPPDPEAQAKIQMMIDHFHRETERRYRNGEGPLLLDLKAEDIES